MKILLNLLTVCFIALAFQTGCTDSADEKETIKPEAELNLTVNQKEFVQGLNEKDVILDAEWIDDSTLNITIKENSFPKPRAEQAASRAASDMSFILEKEICVNILYPSGKNLATVCDHDKGPE